MSERRKSGEKIATVAVLAARRQAKGRSKPASDAADPTVSEAADPEASEAVDPAAQFRSKAQAHALDALAVLASLLKEGSSDAVRASAANSVIDRAHGRAAQAVRVGGSGGEDAEGVELSFTWLTPEKS